MPTKLGANENMTQALLSIRSPGGKRQTSELASQNDLSVKSMVNPGASGTEWEVGIMVCLYNSKIHSESTGIVFCLLRTYIHTGNMTIQAILWSGYTPSSLPKLADPFPRSLCPPGMAEKLTL